MQIQWYPGHMTRTRRRLEKIIPQADGICEIVDARIPASSRNPDLDTWATQLPRLMILNRVDQADPAMTAAWKAYYKSLGMAVIETNGKNGDGIRSFEPAVRSLLAEKLERYAAKGQTGRPVRMLILGIPNVGKSSLINRLVGRRAAKAEDRPGVTRDGAWFTLTDGIELYDTPGMLWPKIDDDNVGMRLAFTGAIRDDVLDTEELASALMECLSRMAPDALCARYRLDPDALRGMSAPAEDDGQFPVPAGYRALEYAARKRGFLISGGEPDTERMSRILLDEFREGKLGRITLEAPPVK